jgi:type IV secretion system protein VirD4
MSKALYSNKKIEKPVLARIILISAILLADISLLPWILKFPFFLHGDDMINAPNLWMAYGPIKAWKDIIFFAAFRKLFLFMQMPVGALILAIAWNTDRLKRKNRIIDGVGGPEPAGYGQFGTSRWQNKAEMDMYSKVWHSNEPIKKGGIISGMEKSSSGKEKVWLNDEDTHTLLIGATRSGKDRKILFPSIWELANAGESMIVGDPKGEMYITSKDYLKSKGYNVIVLNFREPLKGNRWNILDLVNKSIDKGDIPKATEYAWDIASTMGKLVPYSGGEPIWKNGGESTIASLVLLAALESEFKFQRHMTTAYYLLAEYGQPLEDESIPLLDYIKKLPVRHPAKAAFATASIAPYKTRASFFTTVLSDMRLFSDPNISDMTSEQDHDFESIGIDKTAVFLIIPDEKNTRNVLATLYVSQAYQSLVNLANSRGGRIPRRVNIILNEFGNLPAFPDFPTMLTVGGGRGIRFCIAIQDVAQIKTLYKEASQTIQGNCSTWIFLKTADVETAKLISEKTGKYTVETESLSSSIQSRGHSSTHGTQTTGRSLLMPDEVLRWNIGESLVLPTGIFPARYPLPDLSMWNANIEYGFVPPSGDIDLDKERNRQIIEKRWADIKGRPLQEISIWLPEIDIDLPSKNTFHKKNIVSQEPVAMTAAREEAAPAEENLKDIDLNHPYKYPLPQMNNEVEDEASKAQPVSLGELDLDNLIKDASENETSGQDDEDFL